MTRTLFSVAAGTALSLSAATACVGAAGSSSPLTFQSRRAASEAAHGWVIHRQPPGFSVRYWPAAGAMSSKAATQVAAGLLSPRRPAYHASGEATSAAPARE